MINIKNKRMILFVFIVTVLTISFKYNYAFALSNHAIKDICHASEKIMVSNLHYYDLFQEGSLFLKYSPDLDAAYLQYYGGSELQRETFVRYASSLCLHRYIYYFIMDIFKNRLFALQVMHGLNCFLLASMIGIIFVWLSKYSSLVTIFIATIILCLFSPSLARSGKNLYWASYSLFFPMVSSIGVIYYKKGRYLTFRNCFVIAFLASLVKQLFYYEFITTSMIAMTVPYFWIFALRKIEIKTMIKFVFAMIFAVILSFGVTTIIKLFLFAKEASNWKGAVEALVRPFIYRLFGDFNSNNQLVLDSANASYFYVIKKMLTFPIISIKGVGDITYLHMVVLNGLYFLFRIIKQKETSIWGIDKNLFDTWLFVTGISLLAPLSWFVIAKPHTYIHTVQCSITWYLPYSLMILVFTIFILIMFVKKHLNIINKTVEG